jgi:hypothetical protein
LESEVVEGKGFLPRQALVYLHLAQRLREAAANGTNPADLLAMVDDVTAAHRRQVAARRPTDAPTELTRATRSPRAIYDLVIYFGGSRWVGR